jgi:hypothetical protein
VAAGLLILHPTGDSSTRLQGSLSEAIWLHFAEIGIVAGLGIRRTEHRLATLSADGDLQLPDIAAGTLCVLIAQLREVTTQARDVEAEF